MANLSAAFGARPIRHKNGAAYNGAVRLYYTTGATAMYIGDPVIVLGGAYGSAYYGSPAGSLPLVGIATAGTTNPLTGFVQGFYPEQATSSVYNPSGSGRGVFVADDNDLLFSMMDDGVAALINTQGSTGALSQTGNLNGSTYSGSTATGRSGWTISTTLGSGAAGADQIRFIGLSEYPGNAVGKNAVWEIMINNHTLNPNVAGV